MAFGRDKGSILTPRPVMDNDPVYVVRVTVEIDTREGDNITDQNVWKSGGLNKDLADLLRTMAGRVDDHMEGQARIRGVVPTDEQAH